MPALEVVVGQDGAAHDGQIGVGARNNITTGEHPLGVYHPHAELHHIKKENIGLPPTMGRSALEPTK